MPATEETYRRQPTLHLVFAISSIAMLLVTVWMVMADHLRPWKEVQREFQLIERDKLKASEKEKQEELEHEVQGASSTASSRRSRRRTRAPRSTPRRFGRSITSSAQLDGDRRSGSTWSAGSRRPSSTASAASTTA